MGPHGGPARKNLGPYGAPYGPPMGPHGPQFFFRLSPPLFFFGLAPVLFLDFGLHQSVSNLLNSFENLVKPLKNPLRISKNIPKPLQKHQNARKAPLGTLPELSRILPRPSNPRSQNLQKHSKTFKKPPEASNNLHPDLPDSSQIFRLRNFVTFVLGAVAGTQLCCAVG